MKLTSTVVKSGISGKRRRIECANVGFLQRRDSRVRAQSRVKLPAPDIDRIDAAGAARDQHVGKAAGRGADIKADVAFRIEAEMIERGGQLHATA